MKNRLLLAVSACCGWFLAGSCGISDPGVKVEEINGEKLYVCEVNKVKDSMTLPLSELVESLHIVKLDTARDALIKGGIVVLSENYIGIKPWDRQPFKLFDKQGKYLRDIGAIGKGPGEYLVLGCSQIDEANNQIYLLPWQTGQLLRYDLEGNMLPPVKLACDFIPKGRFSVKDGRLTVFTLPFKGSVKYLAFQQDLDTTVYSKIPVEPYAIPFDYSNEVFHSGSGELPDVYVFQFFNPAQDSLFHYDAANNRLIPRLTADFGTGKVPMHSLGELSSKYFYIETAEVKQIEKQAFTGDNYKYILIQKKNPRANYFHIEDDLLLKGEPVSVYAFTNGMYIQNWAAINLKTKLEKVLERDDLSEEIRARVTETLSGLSEDDNNVIVWGKMKK